MDVQALLREGGDAGGVRTNRGLPAPQVRQERRGGRKASTSRSRPHQVFPATHFLLDLVVRHVPSCDGALLLCVRVSATSEAKISKPFERKKFEHNSQTDANLPKYFDELKTSLFYNRSEHW